MYTIAASMYTIVYTIARTANQFDAVKTAKTARYVHHVHHKREIYCACEETGVIEGILLGLKKYRFIMYMVYMGGVTW